MRLAPPLLTPHPFGLGVSAAKAQPAPHKAESPLPVGEEDIDWTVRGAEMSSPSDALTDAELEALFAPLAAAARIALAVSGGPDSLALLAAIDRWRRSPGRPEGLVLTVDHRLREGSEREAHRVAAIARRRGMPARVLSWRGPRPNTGIQAAARVARYCLLIAA